MHLDLDKIYRTYKDNIYGIGFNYFRNPSDAEDVLQETFYKLSRSNKEFDSEEHVRNWLIRVAVNECKKVSLSPWRKKMCNIDEYANSLVFTTPEASTLFTEVMKLKPKYRQVLHLFYYENYKVAEIAQILGISQTAVTTRLERGRAGLKVRLKEEWRNE